MAAIKEAQSKSDIVRAIAVVGPTGAGKTTLVHGLRAAAAGEPVSAPGSGRQSIEMALGSAEFLGDQYVFVDTPGAFPGGDRSASTARFQAGSEAACPEPQQAEDTCHPAPSLQVLAVDEKARERRRADRRERSEALEDAERRPLLFLGN